MISKFYYFTAFLFIIPFFCGVTYGQDTTLLIIYKIGKSAESDSAVAKIKNSPQKNLVVGMYEADKHLEANLYCSRNESVFYLKDILVPEGQEINYKIASILFVSPGDTYYTSAKPAKNIRNTSFNNEMYNIITLTNKYNWVIDKSDSKKIAGYMCYKAVGTWSEYSARKKMIQTFHPTVWFTYDLPFPFGPKNYSGLPGLILESSDSGRKYIYAAEIKKNVKIPKKILVEPVGKTVTEEQYVELTTPRIFKEKK